MESSPGMLASVAIVVPVAFVAFVAIAAAAESDVNAVTVSGHH